MFKFSKIKTSLICIFTINVIISSINTYNSIAQIFPDNDSTGNELYKLNECEIEKQNIIRNLTKSHEDEINDCYQMIDSLESDKNEALETIINLRGNLEEEKHNLSNVNKTIINLRGNLEEEKHN